MSDAIDKLDVVSTEDNTGRYWKWFIRRNGQPIGGFFSRTDADKFIQSVATIGRLTTALRLVASQDEGCGGRVTEAEAWRSAQRIARDALLQS